MKCLILLGLISAACAAFLSEDFLAQEWISFQLKHADKYKPHEMRLHFEIHIQNRQNAIKTSDDQKTPATPKLETPNRFSIPKHEMKTFQLFNRTVKVFGQITPEQMKRFQKVSAALKNPKDLPDTVDWNKGGAVTDVMEQGACKRGGYSFAATGALEGQMFMKTGNLVSLSEQNIIDCSYVYGNAGCRYGGADIAFWYVKVNGGINTEDKYPYEAKQGKCRYSTDDAAATVTGVAYLDLPGEEILKAVVAIIGPVATPIDASHQSFETYDGGVYIEPDCDSFNFNHVVLLVGYGTDESGQDYWLVKNSYGKDWGEDGYIRMARNMDNQCGIASAIMLGMV